MLREKKVIMKDLTTNKLPTERTMKFEIPLVKTKSSQIYVKSTTSIIYNILAYLKNNNVSVICIDDRENEIKTRIEKVWIEANKVWVKLSTNVKCVKLIIELK